MAGHSKWANIRHRKERQDKKRGAAWSKCSKAIMVAARQGGPDPDSNLALRYAIDEAKYANMPKDTIKRAIDKGAGAQSGENFEEITYEGFGPCGVAVIIDALTDNKNRSVTDIRTIFKKAGCSLGTSGSVAHMFQTRGQIFLNGDIDEDTLMELALEAGAEDVIAPENEGDPWTVLTAAADFLTVKDALENADMNVIEAQIAKLPNDPQVFKGEDVGKLLAFFEALEDCDDVHKVFWNAEFDESDAEGA